MNKLFSTIAVMVLLIAAFAPAGHAQSFGSQAEAVGVWSFFVTIDGAPPCQCIQIARLNLDGTMAGPANDHLSSSTLGEWKRGEGRTIKFAFVQNVINADGSAGGEYVIRGTMTLLSSSSGTGTSKFDILDISGKPVFSGTATFTATKLQLD